VPCGQWSASGRVCGVRTANASEPRNRVSLIDVRDVRHIVGRVRGEEGLSCVDKTSHRSWDTAHDRSRSCSRCRRGSARHRLQPARAQSGTRGNIPRGLSAVTLGRTIEIGGRKRLRLAIRAVDVAAAAIDAGLFAVLHAIGAFRGTALGGPANGACAICSGLATLALYA